MSCFSENKLPSSFANEIESISSNTIVIRSNIRNLDECNTWISEFGKQTNTKWNTRNSKPCRTKFICSKKFVCHHSSFQKVPAEKNTRSVTKNSSCLATINIKVKLQTTATKKKDPFIRRGLFAVITLNDVHNHSLNTAEALKFLPAADCKKKFFEYFNDGMGIAESCKYHEGILEFEDKIMEVDMANSRINPPYRTVRYWYDEWRLLNQGPKIGNGVIEVCEQRSCQKSFKTEASAHDGRTDKLVSAKLKIRRLKPGTVPTIMPSSPSSLKNGRENLEGKRKRAKFGVVGTSSQPNPTPLADFSSMSTLTTQLTSSKMASTTEQAFTTRPTVEKKSSKMAPTTEQAFTTRPTIKQKSSKMAPTSKQPLSPQMATQKPTMTSSKMAPTTEQTSKMAPTSKQPSMATRKPKPFIKLRKKNRRIVDLYFFLDEFQQLNRHSKSGCSINDIYIEYENKVGLVSCFHCRCRVCGYFKLIWSEDPEDVSRNINSATVSGFLSIGCGFILMTELFSKMSLPILNHTLFLKESKKLAGAKIDAGIAKNVDACHHDEKSDQMDDEIQSFIIKDEIEIAEDKTELDGTEFEFETIAHESDCVDQTVIGSNGIAAEKHQRTAKIDKKVTEASRIFSEKEVIKTKKKIEFAVNETVLGEKDFQSEKMEHELNRRNQMVIRPEATATEEHPAITRVDKSLSEIDRIAAENKPIKIKEEIICPEEEDKLEWEPNEKMLYSNEIRAESFTLGTEEIRIPIEIAKIAHDEIRITPIEIKTVETSKKIANLIPETVGLHRNTYDFNRKVAVVATDHDKTVTASDRLKPSQEILSNRESISRVQHRDVSEEENAAAFHDVQSQKRLFQEEIKELLDDDGDNSVNRGEASLSCRKRKWGQLPTKDT